MKLSDTDQKGTGNTGETIFIASLGQLVDTNMSKSINEFAGLVKEKYPKVPLLLAKGFVWVSFFVDKYFIGTVDKYKKGDLTEGTFRTRICKQLGGIDNNNNTKFNKAWHAMCEVTNENIACISSLVNAQKETNFKLLIASGTNPIQYDYIMEEIRMKYHNNFSGINKELHPNPLLGNINHPIKIVRSYDPGVKELSHAKIAAKGIEKFQYDKAGNRFVSLHRDVNAKNLKLEHAKFEQITTNKTCSWIKAIQQYISKIRGAMAKATQPALGKEHQQETSIASRVEAPQSSHSEAILRQRASSELTQGRA
jgi:hypothetical protein